MTREYKDLYRQHTWLFVEASRVELPACDMCIFHLCISCFGVTTTCTSRMNVFLCKMCALRGARVLSLLPYAEQQVTTVCGASVNHGAAHSPQDNQCFPLSNRDARTLRFLLIIGGGDVAEACGAEAAGAAALPAAAGEPSRERDDNI